MKNEIIKVENLNYKVIEKGFFGGLNEKPIITDVSFNLMEKEILGIVGESGSGKTTLAKLVMGIIAATSGKIKFNLTENKRSGIQILFQNSEDIINPLRKIDDVINESVRLFNRKAFEEIKFELLDQLKINSSLLEKKGYQLSGGEKQRVALARILAVRPEVLILDEPFSAQDVESQLNMIELISFLNKKNNISFICISHQINLLKHFSDRIMVLNKGSVAELGKTKEVLNLPKQEFTKKLLAAERLI
ncbi:MAG: ATP-binding cassette domain-containing protein [Melioribacteraceae bacterium]|nr:ATP-binding cassette domain-containing protein [Melioribacteraceae bacterium]